MLSCNAVDLMCAYVFGHVYIYELMHGPIFNYIKTKFEEEGINKVINKSFYYF